MEVSPQHNYLATIMRVLHGVIGEFVDHAQSAIKPISHPVDHYERKRMKNRRSLWTLLLLVLVASLILAACAAPAEEATEEPAEEPAEEVAEEPAEEPAEEAAEEPAEEVAEEPTEEEAMATLPAVDLVMWSQDEPALEEEIVAMFDAWAETHAPGSTLEITHYDTENLRTEFQTAALAGTGPDFMWTVNDHAGPFTTAGLIQPVDDLVDLSLFVEGAVSAVEIDGQHWGIPVSNGNHLMLLYNKSIIDTPPTTVDELIALKDSVPEGIQPFAYNLNEPFWLVPWWGAFGANPVLGEDGHTPSINTEGMVQALQLVHDFKYTYGIVPQECDYDCADTLFKEGQVAVIINGDWSLAGYKDVLGDDLGVAVIPTPEGGSTPAPYTSGKFLMFPISLEGDKYDVAVAFAQYLATDVATQIALNVPFSRLPALTEALDDEAVTGDAILAGSAMQMAAGTGMPPQAEMRCVWDSLRPNLEAVMGDASTPEDAAAAAQAAADQCVADLE
jgi:arabinogalactan oligomer/maltooligosaccharide transport system substrate-binding protein